jgi:hypothetical protein
VASAGTQLLALVLVLALVRCQAAAVQWGCQVAGQASSQAHQCAQHPPRQQQRPQRRQEQGQMVSVVCRCLGLWRQQQGSWGSCRTWMGLTRRTLLLLLLLESSW